MTRPHWCGCRRNMACWLQHEGTAFNQARNCAVTWGPDVTRRFLRQTSLELIIRSHQVVPGGIQMSHGDRVLTLFSASNYCGGSYDGATLVLEPGFDVAALAKRCCPARFTHNVKPLVQTHSLMPRKALLEAGQGDYSEFVRACLAAEAIMTRRDELFDHFSEQDTQRTGDVCAASCVCVCVCLCVWRSRMTLRWLLASTAELHHVHRHP